MTCISLLPAEQVYNYEVQSLVCVCVMCICIQYTKNTHHLHFNFMCMIIKETVPLACINLLSHHISQNDCEEEKK